MEASEHAKLHDPERVHWQTYMSLTGKNPTLPNADATGQYVIPPQRSQPLEYDKPTIGAWLFDNWLWLTPTTLGLIGLIAYLVR